MFWLKNFIATEAQKCALYFSVLLCLCGDLHSAAGRNPYYHFVVQRMACESISQILYLLYKTPLMKIFITYSRFDQQQATQLVRDLEELGHDIWFDQELTGGQSWWDNILSKIRDCEVYIFAVSQESLDSTACKRELKYAEALHKNSLPVLFKPGISVAMAPRFLSHMQFINYTNPGDKTAVFALIKAITNLPAQQPLPDPLPEPPDVPISYLDKLKDKIESPSLDKRDQVELLGDLKSKLNDPEINTEDIIVLLKKLRRHDDLLASVGTEIDVLLNTPVQKNIPKQQAPPPPKYPEERKSAPAQPSYSTAPKMQQAAAPAATDNGWSAGIMVLLILGSFIPIIGIIFGIIGMAAGGAKKTQGIILLIIGVVMALIYASLGGMESY
jgi:hypothetical protein